jgi:hypothetical protein
LISLPFQGTSLVSHDVLSNIKRTLHSLGFNSESTIVYLIFVCTFQWDVSGTLKINQNWTLQIVERSKITELFWWPLPVLTFPNVLCCNIGCRLALKSSLTCP